MFLSEVKFIIAALYSLGVLQTPYVLLFLKVTGDEICKWDESVRQGKHRT